jgi:predicted lipoprotein with Yx(FWY)xxD motif
MRRTLAALAIPAVAVAVAVSGGAGSAAGSTTRTAAASAATKVELQKTKLGTALADGRGRTLYLFEKDKRGSKKSTCFGQCAVAWPPVTTTGTPQAARGVSASKLGTIRRGHGVKQVTYNGWPLYRFQGDTRARQTNGEGINAFGAKWYVVSAAGKRIK